MVGVVVASNAVVVLVVVVVVGHCYCYCVAAFLGAASAKDLVNVAVVVSHSEGTTPPHPMMAHPPSVASLRLSLLFL